MGDDRADDAAPTDGGDVAEAREPDAIQREIEQTRAELADTIDAIAERISPRRAASRGAAKVKGGVQSVLGRDENGGAPASVLDASAARAAGPAHRAGPREIREAAEIGGTAFTGTSEFETRRVLRTDRVLIAGGLLAALVAVIVLLRRRR
jgi:hypothetical protein